VFLLFYDICDTVKQQKTPQFPRMAEQLPICIG
jgi:hypothetical protein